MEPRRSLYCRVGGIFPDVADDGQRRGLRGRAGVHQTYWYKWLGKSLRN